MNLMIDSIVKTLTRVIKDQYKINVNHYSSPHTYTERVKIDSYEGTSITTIHLHEIYNVNHPFFALTRDLHYHSQGEIA